MEKSKLLKGHHAVVTGSTGFLGANLVRELIDRDWQVTAFRRRTSSLARHRGLVLNYSEADIRDPKGLLAAIPEGADVLFHLAADLRLSDRASDEQIKTNVQGTTNVLKAAQARSVSRVVLVSSMAAFGLHPTPVDETVTSNAISIPIGYFKSKYLAEIEAERALDRGLDVTIVNPSNIIGAFDDTNLAAVMIRLIANSRMPVMASGEASFCHARAVAAALVNAAEWGRIGERYLLGGADASFPELAKAVAEITGGTAPTALLPRYRTLEEAQAVSEMAVKLGQDFLSPEIALATSARMLVIDTKARRELNYAPSTLQQMISDQHNWLRDTGRLAQILESDTHGQATFGSVGMDSQGAPTTIGFSTTENALRQSPYIADAGLIQTKKGIEALVAADVDALTNKGLLNPREAIGIELATLATKSDGVAQIADFQLVSGSIHRDQNGRAIQTNSLGEEVSVSDRIWLDMEPRKSAWTVINAFRPGASVDLEGNLLVQLGVDSFGLMELSLELERATGVLIPPADIARMPTARAVLTEMSRLAFRDLDEEDSEETKSGAEASLSSAEKMLRLALISTNDFLVHLIFSIDVSGTENLEALNGDGGIILPNHVSDLDPLVLASALPPKLLDQTVWAAIRSRVFDNRVKREIARVMNVFPVDEAAPEEAVSMALRVLEEKNVLIWFPEGWRSPNGKLLPFHEGIGHIVERSGATIVPTLISGTLEAWPRGHKLPRPGQVKIVFGEPISTNSLLKEIPSSPDRPTQLCTALHQRMLCLGSKNGLALK